MGRDKGKKKDKGKDKAKKKDKEDKEAKKAKKAKKANGKKAHWLAAGFRSATPHLMQQDCKAAIAFYEKAFGAKLKDELMLLPDGKVAHAEVFIGDSIVMMSDEAEMPDSGRSPKSLGGHTAGLMLYVKDCDKAFAKAVEAGARVQQAPTDMFWGDRYSRVADPFGHVWALCTHVKDMSTKQVRKAQAEFMAAMAAQGTASAEATQPAT